MIWIVAAIFAAFFNALKNILTRQLGDAVDRYSVAVLSNFFMLPVLWLNVLILSPHLTISPEFWWLMLLMLPVEIGVMLLFFKALTSSNLMHSFPFVSFMPVFVAIGSYFILDELLSPQVYVGLAVIVAGAFIMHMSKDTKQADVTGALYILGVAALWGYLIPMGTLAIDYSSAQLYPALYFTLATLCFLPIFFLKRSTSVITLWQYSNKFLFIGVTFGIFTAANWFAYSLGPATAISALAMLSIPFTSILSAILHKERIVLRKIIAGVAMTIGAVIVILA